jgi:hypothetical protein
MLQTYSREGEDMSPERPSRQMTITSNRPTNEMVRGYNLPLRRRTLAAVSEEDHRHADSSVGIELGKTMSALAMMH